MNPDLKTEDILKRVRAHLNNSNIKLWLNPYYKEDGVGENEEKALQLLSKQVSEEIKIDQECCIAVLKDLQTRALERLNSNKVFEESGMAMLRIKMSGLGSIITLDIALTATCDFLTHEIGKRVNLPSHRLKLICRGRVLQPALSLVSQGVKNGAQMMALVMAEKNKLEEEENALQMLEATKSDLLRLQDPNSNSYFVIENQSGEVLNIPAHEEKALATAMTFHEKGRAALKRNDYTLALVMFLEADKEYSDCTSELLNSCDNYALLHLDIAWCYLCVGNAAQIPDADRRLRLCEQNFHKSYGRNMERLVAIKGSTGNEMALFVRLHLLQGVVHFHHNRRAEAKKMFEQALAELNKLKVSDNSLSLLMEIGFSSSEARLGLRATYGNVEAAEELINKKRKEREKFENLNKDLQRKRKLGLCQDGKQWCEPVLVTQLQAMGFSKQISVDALKMANNKINEAVTIIQETPHLLPSSSTAVSEEMLAQVISLGYDRDFACKALEQHPFLQREFRSLPSLADTPGASCSADSEITKSASAITFLENYRKSLKTEVDKEKRAFEGLCEDHLDIILEQEEAFLIQYLSLLE